MADTLALGASPARGGGSSPLLGTVRSEDSAQKFTFVFNPNDENVL